MVLPLKSMLLEPKNNHFTRQLTCSTSAGAMKPAAESITPSLQKHSSRGRRALLHTLGSIALEGREHSSGGAGAMLLRFWSIHSALPAQCSLFLGALWEQEKSKIIENRLQFTSVFSRMHLDGSQLSTFLYRCPSVKDSSAREKSKFFWFSPRLFVSLQKKWKNTSR